MVLFLEPYAKVFLSLHGFISFLAVVFFAAGFYLFYKRKAIDWGAGLSLTKWGIVTYVASFVLGLLIYPVFRVKVRAEYFDSSLPWATGIFEIKEHLASIGLFIVLALALYYYAFQIQDSQKPIKQSFINLIFLTLVVLVLNTIMGVLLVGLRSI